MSVPGDRPIGGWSRPSLVVVSNSPQARETLSIMLGRDFDIDEEIEAPFATHSGAGPVAIVVAPTTWDNDLLPAVRRRWPATPLVMMDPPAEVAKGAPTARVGSWSDPLALPSLVSAAIGPPVHLDGACTAIAQLVQECVGRDLRASRLLSALVVASEDRHSVRLGLRFLRERMLRVMEAFEWIESGLPAQRPDLVEALLAAQRRHSERFARRGLRIEVRGEPRFPMPASSEFSRIAGALCSHLLRLPPGIVTVSRQGRTLVCSHPELVASESLPLLVAIRGLQMNGAEVSVGDGFLYATLSEA